MHVNFNGQELEMSFGLKFLNEIDKELGFDVEQMAVGQGLNLLVPNLRTNNIAALSKIIRASVSHHKKYPKTDEELETVLTDIMENNDISDFCEEILNELGKNVLTQNLVPDEYKKNKKKK
ncbi:tail assembly chaperone [Staphylococcus warneri]|uniref:tail assembly chaperone n=1 Tax=Staphylococcus warneri TaxID=1292 RepID=UPI000D1D4234|nr:tail assembly chaperone [Staphylococcus warneri]AXZ23695.1 phage tail protein [Staphylococcus warneri]AXZ23760.1 phage tail protein [Staphylococcus warneri]PTI07166.1 phage tail protein [Staphylococcus warneri]PTI34183.1 phage tail protein [Staphylococcus warneri]RIN22381.1 phage tail protein [Staphylococcus warneri]